MKLCISPIYRVLVDIFIEGSDTGTEIKIIIFLQFFSPTAMLDINKLLTDISVYLET